MFQNPGIQTTFLLLGLGWGQKRFRGSTAVPSGEDTACAEQKMNMYLNVSMSATVNILADFSHVIPAFPPDDALLQQFSDEATNAMETSQSKNRSTLLGQYFARLWLHNGCSPGSPRVAAVDETVIIHLKHSCHGRTYTHAHAHTTLYNGTKQILARTVADVIA